MNHTIKQTLVTVALTTLATFAQAQVAVIANPANPGVTKEQVTNVFLGRSCELKPQDLPEGSPLRDQFYKKLADRDAAQIKALWARVIFTGKGQAPLMLPDTSLTKKAVATDPKAIGYIEKAAVDATVKVLFILE